MHILSVFLLSVCWQASFAATERESDDYDEASRLLATSGVQGGLVVHLGCGDGRLTSAFHVDDRFLVHGLDTDAAIVGRARESILAQGRYGKVSVFDGGRLPYADNASICLLSRANVTSRWTRSNACSYRMALQ
jgi:hypothetical protein